MKTCPVLIALLALLAAGSAGCASLDMEDPIDQAKEITRIADLAEKDRTKFENSFDIVSFKERILSPDWDASELDPLFRLLDSSQAGYRRILEINLLAVQWRYKLAVVLGYEGKLHQLRFIHADEIVKRAEENGGVATAEQKQLVESCRADFQDELKAANKEYRFFLNNLMGRAGKEFRRPVYIGLYNNYILLGDWENAATIGRDILTALPLSADERSVLKRDIEEWDELVLKKSIQDEESRARAGQ